MTWQFELTEDDVADALDGLYAYETGSFDSGIHDVVLQERVKAWLKANESKAKELLREIVHDMIDRDGPMRGNVESAASFLRWLDHEMGCRP